MSDWAAVVLVLGLSALVVAVYAVRALVGVKSAVLNVNELRASCELTARNSAALDGRLAKVEAALRIDGQRAMAQANHNNLPAMMRMLVAVVAGSLVVLS